MKEPAKGTPEAVPTQPRSCRATLAAAGDRYLGTYVAGQLAALSPGPRYMCLKWPASYSLLYLPRQAARQAARQAGWSSRWDGQATVDLQQAALLHATGPMQVGAGRNRGTGCGQITVRRSVGSMWTHLLTWGGFISPPTRQITPTTCHHHLPPPSPQPQILLQR